MPIDSSDINGQWVVDDPNKLHLVAESAVAVACGGSRGIGSAIVSHLGMPRLRSRIEILPLDMVYYFVI